MSECDDQFEAFACNLIEQLHKQESIPSSARSVDGNVLSLGNLKVNLRSLYRTYALQSPELQAQQLQSFVNCLARGREGVDDHETFADVKAHLRPKLWPRTMISLEGFDIPFCLVGEHLVLSVVYDTPSMMQSVNWSRFNKWGIAFSEALRCAFENIEPASTYAGVSRKDGGPGHCSDATYDNYGNARFLTDRPYSLYSIGYPRWAFPGGRDVCTICQADQPEDIEFNIEMALSLGDDDPKPLPPFPLVDHGQGWINWYGEPGSPAARMLKRRQFDYALSVSERQTYYLQSTADGRNDFSLVESLIADKSSADSHDPKSTTKWWADCECLLPTADFIIFPDRNGFKFAWNDVIKVCGDRLMPAEGLYPSRWRTNGSPTEHELEALERMACE